jgi:hypothetical protein
VNASIQEKHHRNIMNLDFNPSKNKSEILCKIIEKNPENKSRRPQKTA